MSIILRTNKGKALSYDEMDRNQSQFFYSSSLHDDNTRLRLHYTGSENLDTATEDYGPNRYQEINLPSLNTDSLTANAAGNSGDIQFKNINGQFDALSSFKFDKTQKFLGIGTGTPEEKLDIRGDGYGGASINLKGSNNPFNEAHTKHASINFYESNTYIGQIGRVDSTTNDLYFTNNFPKDEGFGKVHIGIGTAKINPSDPPNSRYNNAHNIVAATFTRTSTGISRVGIGTKDPNRQLSLVGTEGIGLSTTSPNTNQSIIRPINAGSEEDVFYPTVAEGKRLVPNDSTSAGLLLSSPETLNGGNVVIAINTDNNKKEGFNIINAQNGSYTNSEVIFSAQASGKVGINTNFPSVEGLTVVGDIVSSGDIEIEGTATIETINTGTAENTSALIATSTGLIQKIAAAPVPIGGIIMWSGSTNDIPDGWALCEGTTVNGKYVPDLTNRFILGAVRDGTGNNTYPNIVVNQENSLSAANAVLVAHEHSLTINQSNHGHDFKAAHESGGGRDSFGFPQTDCNCARLHKANTGAPTSMTKTSIGSGYYQGNAIGGSKACILSTSKANKAGLTSSGLTSSTQTGTNANLPPYYALAFIMYVG